MGISNNFNFSLNYGCLEYSSGYAGGGYRKSTVANTEKGGIYVKPLANTPAQKDTIKRAIDELKDVKFSPKDVIRMRALGVNLPYKDGAQAVRFLKAKGAEFSYADFSNTNVHACLDTTKKHPAVLINSKYKDMASHADILAISEAMFHEAGHAKDGDSLNSIQEELDCLALNALAHRYYRKRYPGIFENQTSPLFSEGVNLYENLFFDKDPEKAALKRRVTQKYGYLDTYSPGHAVSRIALDITQMADAS